MTRLFIGSDHGAVELKAGIIEYINNNHPEIELENCGVDSAESVDYPDIAADVCEQVIATEGLGILCCGTGIGMSMKANRYKGIRAALVYDVNTATLTKQHNNANVLCMGGRTHSVDEATAMIEAWLTTEFEGDRHNRRLDKLDN